jgi:NNP family nitrate/nitrite transporter-like MFS transporter
MRGVTGKEAVRSAYQAPVGTVIDEEASKKFGIKVDMEHRATQLVVWKFWQHPHTVSFWVSTMGFFISFLATFAAAPLMPVIRDNLNLTKSDIVNSGIAAVTGTIGARVAMGAVCDLVGPRYGMACILLLTSPFVFGMAGVTNAAGFIACRCFIGLSLAAFVSNQFWATLMYNRAVVGAANATSGGWGNLGGGITQLLMPLFLLFFENVAGATKFQSWRWVYFIPGTAAVITGLTALTFGQDAPDGNYHTLKQKKQMMTDKVWKIYWVGCKNYRMWIAVLLYAFCFGVELTINNIIASYFYDRFELDLTVAGVVASCFGMMNLFARSVGGILSDTSARFFGMRGRLWVLFLTLALEGTFCAVLGAMDTLASSIVVMIIFSFFVQASEGATYGIVPFISRRALGVVAGFVGAGGNAGSSITQAAFFAPDSLTTAEGIKWMGVTIVGVSFFTVFIHFPQWGSMFFPGNPTTVSEEDYYGSEYNETEKKSGLADNSMKFAASSGAERGSFFEKSRNEKLEKIKSSQSARSE